MIEPPAPCATIARAAAWPHKEGTFDVDLLYQVKGVFRQVDYRYTIAACGSAGIIYYDIDASELLHGD